MKAAFFVLFLLAVSFVSPAIAQVVVSSTSVKAPAAVTSTSVSSTLCDVALCSDTAVHPKTFNPASIVNYFGTDIGAFSFITSPTGVIWNTTKADSLTMGIPTVGGSSVPNTSVFFNSSHTAYQLSGAWGTLNMFFKQTQYRVKMSWDFNLNSPETVCFPFTAQGSIIQQSNRAGTLLPSIRTGTEIFDWSDISQSFSPSFTLNSLCLNLGIGATNIDPIALDGSAIHGCSSVTSCTVMLSTTSSPDVIILAFNLDRTGTLSFSDSASVLSFTLRSGPITAGSGNQYEYYAIASGTLTADVITITTTAANTFFEIIGYGISGANTGSPFDPNGALPDTQNNISLCPPSGGNNFPCVLNFSTSNANDFLTLACGGSGPSQTAGTGYTIIQTAQGSQTDSAQYKVVSASQSGITIQFGTAIGNANECIGDAIQQAAAANQPVLLTLLVNPSPSPEGGAIFKCAPNSTCFSAQMPTITTISSSTVVTIAASATTTFYIIAQEFSAYIWDGWSGETTYIQDTINRAQTVVVSSWTNSTLSKTLSANFVTPVTVIPTVSSDYSWLLLLPLVLLAIVLSIVRRRF
jgi:hypothetical protein